MLDEQPQYNFDRFLHALAAGDIYYYPFACPGGACNG
jgi:hypothetical protein